MNRQWWSSCYRQAWLSAIDVARAPAGSLILPRYQRGYVWDETKAVALVETILLGLPIGSVILRELGDGRTLVIDGQQRLSTLRGVEMGNGGDVPVVALEYDPSVPSHRVPLRVVIGTGPGRVAVRHLVSKNSLCAMSIFAAGEDPERMAEFESPYAAMRELGAAFSDDKALAMSAADQMLRSCYLPGLCFERSASGAQVVEAFRRINLGGAPMTAEQVEALVATGRSM